MTTNQLTSAILLGAALGLAAGPRAGAAEAARPANKAPVKVFILAGQSNMEGHAKVETFDYIGDDPATAPLLKQMRAPDGTPRVCDHVWLSYLTGSPTGNGEGIGKLTAGYGSRRNPTQDGGKIGPEFTFGLRMDQAVKGPVLIIKTAWGGKSLYADFRPPSAGPFVRPEGKAKKKQADTPDPKPAKADETGLYYHLMIDHVRLVLKDIKRVIPDYDPKQGYEIDGFVWLQGWNDMVNHGVYPRGPAGSGNEYAKYSEWLADFIRDVRKDLGAPQMPFVIGVLGVGGVHASASTVAFREAMAAPASYPEFRGNVVAVQTAPFWDEPLGAIAKKHEQVRGKRSALGNKVKDGKMTQAEADKEVKQFEADLISANEQARWKRGASNAGYHYLGCSKTFALMGQAFANTLQELQKK